MLAIARWKLLYLIEAQKLPGPSMMVSGRRLFTAANVEQMKILLRAHPNWHEAAVSQQSSIGDSI